MSVRFSLRPLTAQDGPALAGLSFSSADSGGVSYAANYQIDAMRAVQALHGDVEGVGATARDNSRLVAVGLARFGECYFEGELRPFALIGNLIVHPDYRGQGLAAQMVECLRDKARARFGEHGVVLANYQSGNEASERLFTRWMQHSAGPLAYLPLRTRPDAPAALRGVMVGPLDEKEYPAFAENYNTFYQDYNLHRPGSAEYLYDLTHDTPVETPFRHAYTAVDSAGNLLAGLVVMEEYRLKQMEIRGLPRFLRALDKIASWVPPDGSVREVFLDHIWYQPGQALAARHLVETVRWIWSNRATNVSVFIDPRGKLKEIFPTRPWSVVLRSKVAIQAPTQMNTQRRVSPIY